MHLLISTLDLAPLRIAYRGAFFVPAAQVWHNTDEANPDHLGAGLAFRPAGAFSFDQLIQVFDFSTQLSHLRVVATFSRISEMESTGFEVV
jgi:hypothetical protein